MGYIQLRLRDHVAFVYIGGRRLARHGQFGNLHMLPLVDALALIDRGDAKLPRHMKLHLLRERVAAEA